MNERSERAGLIAWPEERVGAASGAVRFGSVRAVRDARRIVRRVFIARRREPISARSIIARRPPPAGSRGHGLVLGLIALGGEILERRVGGAHVVVSVRVLRLVGGGVGALARPVSELAALVALVFRPRLALLARVRLRAVARPVPHLAAAVALVVRAGLLLLARLARHADGAVPREAAAAGVSTALGQSRAQWPTPPHLLPPLAPGPPPRPGGEPRSRGATLLRRRGALSSRSSRMRMFASVGVVEHLDGVRGESTVSISTMPQPFGARQGLRHDLGVDDVAGLAEVVLEVLPEARQDRLCT